MTAAHYDLYDTAGTRALEHAAIVDLGIAGLELMQRAGRGAFGVLRARWPQARRIAIVCGAGNNGGDGFVVAELAAAAGLEVVVHLVAERARLRGDAARCFAALQAATLSIEGVPVELKADVIVDALLGTGLEREVSGQYADAIRCMNGSSAPVLSLDVPSGIDATSGRRMGAAVAATVTITFIALKQGLITADAPDCTGELLLDTLDVPPVVYDKVAATSQALDYAAVRARFGRRRRSAHKGDYGHVLVIGGAPGYGGAARMAAEAAARSGAGLVSLATHPAHAAALTAARPELMCHGVNDAPSLAPLMARASVIAVGPGLGLSPWGAALFAAVRERALPMVVDADALTLLAGDPDQKAARVLTPHPGEAARLAALTTADIQRDRFAAARLLCERYGSVIVLKGAGTLVQAPLRVTRVIRGGNPGMASGGMGDVLTGIIAGLLAQGFAADEAAAIGACVHAQAADQAARAGERGMLAGDLMRCIRAAVNPAE